MPVNEDIVSENSARTEELGRSLASGLSGGALILLRGDLGTGKSVVARGIAMGLGVRAWRGSPTFTLINEYEGRLAVFHSDLYRLESGDVEDLGLDEYVRDDSVLIVEWPERAESYLAALPAASLISVDLWYHGEDQRRIRIRESIPADCPS